MRLLILLTAATFLPTAYAATVGSGAPNATATAGFVNAYYRGSFASLTLPPTTDVSSFSTGLIQEFTSRANRNLSYALIKIDPNGPVTFNDTLQVWDTMYSYYGTIGPNAAGLPTIDTTPCPLNTYGTCTYQYFAKNYALFLYSAPNTNGYFLKDPYYTEWFAQGDIAGNLGLPIGAATAVTSISKQAGNSQAFVSGGIYTYTTTTSGTVVHTYSVFGPTYVTYSAAGGPLALGFPTGQEIILASGLHRQVFESGRIEWTPGNPAQILYPLASVDIYGASAGLSLNLGDVVTLNATTTDTLGNISPNRSVSWSVTNGQVLSIQPNGYSAIIKALGKGISNVTATSEGKTSASLIVRVASPCCDVGEGAPTAAITSSFQAAVARNRLSLVLPNATPVTRTAGGYVQQFSLLGGGTAVITQSDKSTVAYALSGNLYSAYIAAGGFASSLGYPAGDASAGGTQIFESGAALAGNPVVVVPAPIRAKWQLLSYETGVLGAPVKAAASYSTSYGSAGQFQTFFNGAIYASTAGAAYASSGLILARYNAISGLTGNLGAPLTDIFTSGAATRQNYENGYIDLQQGASAAIEHINPRKPSLTITPTRLAPGGRVHLVLNGFAGGANLTVSQTGVSDFSVSSPLGNYSWDVVVPSTAQPSTVSVTVKDSSSADVATGTYSVVSLPALAPSLTVVSGDGQKGAPGTLLPNPIVAVLKDINGVPLAGIPVFAAASPGATVQAASVTDSNGLATAVVRLPQSGLAIITLTAGGKVASFSAATAPVSIVGVPTLSQIDSNTLIGNGTQSLSAKGAMVTALAELILYYQSKGQIGAPNGTASPQALNTYLTGNGGYAPSETGDLIPNPWVAMAFAGIRGGISVESPTAGRLSEIVGAGTPALVGITLTTDGAPAGMSYVVATGIAADGTISITDSAYGQSSLAAYTTGFQFAGHAIVGKITALLQVNPALIQPSGFVISATTTAGAAITGAAGSCAPPLTLGDIAIPGLPAAASLGSVQFLACPNTDASYQLSLNAGATANLYDFAGSPAAPVNATVLSAYAIARTSAGITITPQTLALSAVVNSASFTSGLTAGGLATAFGAGFTQGGANLPVVSIGNTKATLYAIFPYQINFQLPAGTPTGAVPITVTSSLGTATQTITISDNAPAIFAIGKSATGASLGAVANQSGVLNAESSPAQRGEYIVIYCTGLGAKVAQGSLQVAKSPVKAVLNGVEVIPAYAGISPGLIGVDQMNVQIPAKLAPSLGSTLLLRQSGQDSNVVQISIQ